MTRYIFVAFIATTFLQLCVCSLFFRQGRFKDGFIRPPPVAGQHQPYPPAQWFEQRLDHFNPQDSRTWQQVCVLQHVIWSVTQFRTDVEIFSVCRDFL